MALAKKGRFRENGCVVYLHYTLGQTPTLSTNIDKNRVILRKKLLDIPLKFRYSKNNGESGQQCGIPYESENGKGKEYELGFARPRRGGTASVRRAGLDKAADLSGACSVEAMRGVVLGGDVLFGNGTYTGSSWQYCLTCEDHYVAFLRENCRGSRRTAEAFIRDFLATRSGEFLFAPVLREGVDAYIHRSTGGLVPGYDCAARSGCGLP